MQITEIKQQLSINSVLNHYGITPDSNGKTNCPFHNDKTPSMQIYPKSNTFCCFSSNCNAGTGDQIQFIELMDKQGKHQAILKAKSLINPKMAEKPTKQATTPTKEAKLPTKETKSPTLTNEEQLQITAKIFNYFRNGFNFRKDNKGKAYLRSRHLDIEKLENLGIVFGYNSAQFHHNGRITPEEMQLCEQAGLLIKSTNWSKTENSYSPWASHCIIFPLTDGKGNILGMYGRSIKTNPKQKTAKHFYLRNSKGLFYRPKQDTKKLIITESIIDFLTLYQVDEIRNNYDFLPIYGTNRLTQEHNEALSQLKNLQEVIFFFDGDQAGLEASRKYSKELSVLGCQISEVTTPPNEDINSLLDGHTAGIFDTLINDRTVIYKSNKTGTVEKEPKVQAVITQKKPAEALGFNSKNENYITYEKEGLKCIILGGVNTSQLDRLKVTIVIERSPKLSAIHQSRQSGLDLYSDNFVDKYIRTTAEKLEMETTKIRLVLAEFIDKIDGYRLSFQNPSQKANKPLNELSPEEIKYYKAFGKEANLMTKINALIGKSGVVGEEKSRQFLFVGAVSHLMKKPLNIVVQGSSGSGKSFLIKKISFLVPQDKVKRFTRLSEKSFYNFGEFELSNTLIIIEDYDGIGEDAEYALREMQSNGELISGISEKNEKTGKIESQSRSVKGPIASMVATTNGEIYHDNSTRVFFIAVDESAEQTAKIIDYKNKKANGEILDADEKEATKFLQNYVSTLKSYKVKNPFLKQIKLPVPHDQLRRLHELFEAFCQQITLIHQHQRSVSSSGELITEKEDMKLAISLMFNSILLKVDELDGSLRDFYERLKKYVLKKGKDYQFSRIEIRQELKVNNTQLHRFMSQLIELEYIHQAGGFVNRGFKYKVSYWDDNEKVRTKIKENLQKQLQLL